MYSNLLTRKNNLIFKQFSRNVSISYSQIEGVTGDKMKHDLNKMVDIFLKHDPVVDALGVTKNREPSQYLRNYLLKPINQGLSIIARNESTKEVIGLVINHIYKSCEEISALKNELSDEREVKLAQIWNTFHMAPMPFKKENFFYLEFCIVDQRYGNYGIGRELSRKSLQLAKDIKEKFIFTECTNHYSSLICEKLGFEKVYSIPFQDVVDVSGKPVLQNIQLPHKHMNIYIYDVNKTFKNCKV